MKTILIAVFSFLISHELFAQQQFYMKKFPANNKTRYITNSPTVRGTVFFYDIPSDTNNVVLYIRLQSESRNLPGKNCGQDIYKRTLRAEFGY